MSRAVCYRVYFSRPRSLAAKLAWTLASRRVHKKMNTDSSAKKRARRVVKVQRGYVGAEKIDEIRKKNAATRPASAPSAAPVASGSAPAKKQTFVQAAIAEAKAKQKAAQAARKAAGGTAKPAGGKGAPAAAKHAGKGR